MKKNENEATKKDILKVCLDYYNHKNRSSIRYMSIRPNPINDFTIAYSEPFTPDIMLGKHLLSQIENINEIVLTNKLNDIAMRANSMDSPTSVRVMFNYPNVERYLDKHAPLTFRQRLKRTRGNEIWKHNFRFNKSKLTLYLPPYGKCIFNQRQKRNVSARFTELITTAKKEGYSLLLIQNKLSTYNKKEMSDDNISAVITALNGRFQRSFHGASVKIIRFVEEDGRKYIRLSVIPTTPNNK